MFLLPPLGLCFFRLVIAFAAALFTCSAAFAESSSVPPCFTVTLHPATIPGAAMSAFGLVGRVTSAKFAIDGQTLLTAGDGAIKYWSAAGEAWEEVFATHAGGIWGMDLWFTPEGRYLARMGGDPRLTLWDAAGGILVTNLACQAAGPSPNGNTLVVLQGSRAVFLDSSHLTESGSIDCGSRLGYHLAFSPDGKWLAVQRGEPNPNEIVILDCVTKREIKTLALGNEGLGPLVFAGGGKLLFMASDSRDALRVWHTTDWRELKPLHQQGSKPKTLALSPDGKTLAVGSWDGAVRLWDVDRLALLDTLRGGAGMVYSVAFSPDGKTLAVGHAESVINLWNMSVRLSVTTLNGHKSLVMGVAFSPDGRTLASVSYDTTLRLWRAPGFEETDREDARAAGAFQ